MKKTLTHTPALLVIASLIGISFYTHCAAAQSRKRKRGKVLIITQDAYGNKLKQIPFSFNSKSKTTNKKGKKLLKVKAKKRFVIEFGSVSGYSIKKPTTGKRLVRVRAGKKKRVKGVYERILITPTEVCDRPVNLADVSNPDQVVGDGTAASCNEAALDKAIASGGTITFNCGSDPLVIPISSEKRIVKDTVIDGGSLITIDGRGRTRILNMDTGNFESTTPHLRVQRLTFTGGKATGTKTRLGIDYDGGGGAIYYRGGSVTAIDCTFTNNKAATVGPDVGGGAIYGVGVGETTIVGSIIDSNKASNGGAVGALHTGVTIVNSTITNNRATGYGGNYQDEQDVQQGSGGNGGALVMDGNGRTLSLCGNTFKDNSGRSLGGALFRTGYESETTVIDRCTIDSNQIQPENDPDLPNGGGAFFIIGTQVTLTASTISNNSSRIYAGAWIGGHGASAPAVANLTNVTITGNYTHPREPYTKRGIGAGLIIGDNTTGTVQNCTIVNNTAQFGSGIINVSPLTVVNSIFYNHAQNIWTPLNCTGSEFSTPPALGQNNLQWPTGDTDDMDCVQGITRSDPLMGALTDNGGLTKTIAPLSGSPALQAGQNCPATDQRGLARAEPCTLGAYEVQ